jgi:hypothetical protein
MMAEGRKRRPKTTRDEIAQAFARVLSLQLQECIQYELLDRLIWMWTEVDGKYDGCRYWSSGARAVRKALRGWKRQVCHDHVIPRSMLIPMLRQTTPETSSIARLLESSAIGCVILREEHDGLKKAGLGSSVPADAAGDVWARYKAVSILVDPPAW